MSCIPVRLSSTLPNEGPPCPGNETVQKSTNCKDVKRYLNVATLAEDGLLIVKQSEPFAPTRQRIVVPRDALPGLLTALHIRLQHPTTYQLKQLSSRYFALDMDKSVEEVSSHCHTCASLKRLPKTRKYRT